MSTSATHRPHCIYIYSYYAYVCMYVCIYLPHRYVYSKIRSMFASSYSIIIAWRRPDNCPIQNAICCFWMILNPIYISSRDVKHVPFRKKKSHGILWIEVPTVYFGVCNREFDWFGLTLANVEHLRAGSDTFFFFDTQWWNLHASTNVSRHVLILRFYIECLSCSRDNLAIALLTFIRQW